MILPNFVGLVEAPVSGNEQSQEIEFSLSSEQEVRTGIVLLSGITFVVELVDPD
jgi:hypothetical protein